MILALHIFFNDIIIRDVYLYVKINEIYLRVYKNSVTRCNCAWLILIVRVCCMSVLNISGAEVRTVNNWCLL